MKLALTSIFGLVPLLLLVGCNNGGNSGSSSSEYNLVTLLGQMTNVSAIAEAPPGTASLVSSHDRKGGNQDWGNYNVPAQKDGFVDVATFEGPGVIRRIWWTGQDAASKWNFFFDGESTPRMVGFQPSEGEPEPGSPHAAFTAPLRARASGGNYCYTPIPYSKSLRIAVAEEFKPARPYFQFNVETFPQGTKVASFPKELSSADQAALTKVTSAWNDLGQSLKQVVERCGSPRSHPIPAGGNVDIAQVIGAGTLNAFTVRLPDRGEETAVQFQQQLRDLVLEVRYDGSDSPSISVPFGDFFCNAFWRRPFSSQYLGYVDGSYVCRLPMPAESGVILTLKNDGATPITVQCASETSQERSENARYLHAAWAEKRSFNRPAGQPLQLMSATGPGHLVSCYLSCYATAPNWYILEGDDLIYRDGEMKASMNGTGLEDYFNGAWYYSGLSDTPWSGLLEKAAMRTSQYRVHGPDKIDFQENLRFAFEFGHVLGSPSGGNTSRGYMSGLTIWYADSPSRAPVLSKNRHVPTDPLERTTALAGVLELEGVGEWDAAADRCDWLAERLSADKDTFQLRAAATRALPGNEPDFTGVQASSLQTRREQRMLAEIPGGKTAVVGMQANGTAQLFVDGKPILTSKSPTILESASFPWNGTHELAIRFSPNQPQAWISAGLRVGDRVIDLLDGSSEFTLEPPPSWPSTAGSKSWSKGFDNSHYRRPTMGVWQLQPNAVPGLQHHPVIMAVSQLDRAKTGKPIYLRRLLDQ